MATEKKEKLADKYHFIGIGGIGMSGLARLLVDRSIVVSGSDLSYNASLDQLEKLGVSIFVGHHPNQIPAGSHVVVTSQVKQDNPEWQQAQKLQLPILHRSDLLKLLMDEKSSLLVAGTHGKTTTTALLTHVLKGAGIDPSYSVGGILLNSGSNAGHGQGRYFVAEADESDGSFLKYFPSGAIITNIDDDHLDYYKTNDNLKCAFEQFIHQVGEKELLFLCGDDPLLADLNMGIQYGFSENCQLRASNYRAREGAFLFDIEFRGKFYPDIEVSLIGRHNALNALAVIGMAIQLQIPESSIRNSLKNFKGVKRRVEKVDYVKEILILDDYGHHPTEIAATIEAIKESYPDRRLIVLHQPHRYTRVRDCLNQYGKCFELADFVLITDIYSAMEAPITGITAAKIIQEIQLQSTVPCRYVERTKCNEEVLDNLYFFDIVLTLGAGDITKEGPLLAKQLEKISPKKMKCAAIFGGKSTEHEISFLSAANVFAGLDPSFYEVEYFYISKTGKWIWGKEAKKILDCKTHSEPASDQVLDCLSQLKKSDVVLPVLHGTFGEDGTIQGLFEILDIAYVGSNYQASAVAMNKALTKRLAESHGLKVAPYLEIKLHQWLKDKKSILKSIRSHFQFPLYVKPVRLGSTIGVNKVDSEIMLEKSIQEAFALDDAILIEKAIIGREIEFAVFGNEAIKVFPPGEIFNTGKTYDYTSKYAKNGFQTNASARLDEKTLKKGLVFAASAYESIGCDGYARVDCFLEASTDEFILNEINPIPGFTETSLYPQICAVHGWSLEMLLNQFILLALKRKRRIQRKIYDKNQL